MIDALPDLAITSAAGVGLGLIYFGGLWYTLRRASTARSPVILLAVSWSVRMAVLMFGLWFTTRGQLPGVLACMLGILVSRSLLIRMTRTDPDRASAARFARPGHAARAVSVATSQSGRHE